MRDQTTINGYYLAALFKYYRQDLKTKVIRHIPLNRIRAQTVYAKYAKTWDCMADLFAKHNVDSDMYIRFLVFEKHCTEYSKSENLFSRNTLIDFKNYIQCLEKRENVFKWFKQSAERIADICLINKYSSAKECITAMIKNKTIGQNYVGGVISCYYLAAIPRFNTIIDKFDSFSRTDLQDVKNNYDIYNTEINSAFLFYRNRRVNPFEYTDQLIFDKKRNTQNQRLLEK